MLNEKEKTTALERFERKLSRRAPGTQRNYRDAFNNFLDWADLDAEELYRLQLDAERGFTNGDAEPYEINQVPELVADYMAEVVKSGKSASHARQTYKATRLFMNASGLTRFKLDPEDKPSSYYSGQASATPEQIRILLDACHGEFKARNEAIITFLKDSGLRVSDLTERTVEEYLRAKASSPEPGFAIYEPIKTIKEGVYAFVHLGPEATKYIDAYLGDRKTGPLFEGRIRDGRRGEVIGTGPLDADSIVVQILRLSKHLPGGGKRISAHSLRKFNRTKFEGAGMPPDWVKKLQGKAASTYSRPEDTGQLTKDPKDKHGYIDCYDSIRIFGVQERELENLRKRIEELERRETERLDRYKRREAE